MPTVLDILHAKESQQIHSIAPSATVLEATRRMNQHQIGALVVMQVGQVVGILSERDVLRRIVAAERPADHVLVAEVMTPKVICCPSETDVEDASRIMKDKRVRHLPVCDGDGSLLGIISIGDLNAFYAGHQEQTIHYLQDYLYGRV